MATEATHGESVSSCVDAAGGAIGMPQLCFEWFPNQMFWLVVTLVAIFFILSRIALPRIAAVLAERADTITNDLAAAENLKKQAEEAEEAFNKALIDARAEAQTIAAQARAEIQAELDSAIADADAKIAAKAAESEKAIADIRATAMENVEVVAKDTTAEIVALFGGKADAGAIADAVAQRTKG